MGPPLGVGCVRWRRNGFAPSRIAIIWQQGLHYWVQEAARWRRLPDGPEMLLLLTKHYTPAGKVMRMRARWVAMW